jgi:hypothetical protein
MALTDGLTDNERNAIRRAADQLRPSAGSDVAARLLASLDTLARGADLEARGPGEGEGEDGRVEKARAKIHTERTAIAKSDLSDVAKIELDQLLEKADRVLQPETEPLVHSVGFAKSQELRKAQEAHRAACLGVRLT